ncbi:MAG: helicase-related protein [Gemmatimonadaceae bacterium]
MTVDTDPPRRVAPAVVLAAIARAVAGGGDEAPLQVGTITLRPHQRDALARIRASIESHGGALLADEPGLGKTYVALALAREHTASIVVAPAALGAMWRGAAARAEVGIHLMSMEALSRRDAHVPDELAGRSALVIVDEAHHVNNPAAARYARLARMAAYRRVLLLSATAVRNRRSELAALLALFMGPRAFTLDDAGRAACVVRRGANAALMPQVDGPHWHRVPALRGVRGALVALPPPLASADGRQAGALLAMSLAHCWASSLAALDAALRRRLLRGAALAAVLDEGRLPTRRELRAWVTGDDAVQLAFPMLASHAAPACAALRRVLDAHLAAVTALRARVHPRVEGDVAARAMLLAGLRRTHPGARIVAFTSHADTATALFRALRTTPGVALLTARGARTAGGTRPRADVIRALSADAVDAPGTDAASARPRRDDISLVITTDLLSEGVNLQGASVIVHLDIPWTPAALEQRVGRAARMGSRHAVVHVHGIATPAGAEQLLALSRRLTRKNAERAAADRTPRDAERLRKIVRRWHDGPAAAMHDSAPIVSTVRGTADGFMAIVGEAETLVSGVLQLNGRWRLGDTPAALCAMAGAAASRGMAPDGGFETAARRALGRWLRYRRARDSGGASGAASAARRAMLGRLDAAIRNAEPHMRAAIGSRVAHVRVLTRAAVSAGAERALDALARQEGADAVRWLDACERELAAVRVHAENIQSVACATRRERAAYTVRALLLIRRA